MRSGSGSSSGLLKRRQLSRTQDASLAAALVHQAYLGRTFELAGKIDAAIAALTLDDVNACLRKYVKPEDFAFARPHRGQIRCHTIA